MSGSRLLKFSYQILIGLLLLAFNKTQSYAQDFEVRSKYVLDSTEFKLPLSYYADARNAIERNQRDLAKELYIKAIEAYKAIYEEAVQNQDWRIAISALIEAADIERRISNDDTPFKTLDLALDILKNRDIPLDDILWFRTYFTVGKTAHWRSDYYVSTAYLDSAQVLYDQSSQYDSTNYKQLVEYKFYGYMFSKKSVDTLQKYIDIRVEQERDNQEKNPNPEEMLYLLEDYVGIYSQKGEYDMALAYAISNYKYAVQHYDDIQDRSIRDKAFYDLALALYRKNEFKKALKVSLEYISNTDSKNNPNYFNTIYLLGLIYNDLDQPNEAIDYFNQYLKTQTDNFVTQELEISKATAILNLGINFYELGDIETANQKYHESLERMKAIVDFPNSALINPYRYMGDFYAVESKWQSALISYDSALRNTDLSYNGNILDFPEQDSTTRFSLEALTILKKKALAMLKNEMVEQDQLKLLRSVLEYVDQTHEKLKTNRSDLYKTDGKLFLSQFFKELYETGIQACYKLYEATGENNYAVKAFNYAQLSKSNLFLEQEKDYKELASSNIPYDLKEEYYSATARLENLKAELYDALENSVTSDSVLRINDQILGLEATTDQLKDSIVENFGPVEEGEEEITLMNSINTNQLMLEYFYGNDDIFSFGVRSSSKVTFKKISLTNDLKGDLEQFLAIVSTPPRFEYFDQDFQNFRGSSKRLFEKLVQPLLPERKGDVDELIVVPDEFLTRLPFEALVVNDENSRSYKDLEYLIGDYQVRYLISSNSRGRSRSAEEVQNKILGIGFSQRESSDESSRAGFASLPGTEREIQFLKASFDGDYYLGAEGSRELFLSKAQNYDIIHLAIHGKADSTNRFQSSLIFNGKDSILNPNQLYLANINARLAVLSACESGMGQIESGEGTFSIARGFAIVGVPNIIMSLWEVNDRTTSSQMVDFYENLLNEGLGLNQSLRGVKLDYIAENDSYASHPYFWASFIHLGSGSDFVDDSSGYNLIMISAALGLLLLLVIGIVIKKKRNPL